MSDAPFGREDVMRIAVLGTGMVGRALAGSLAGKAHTVTMGTREPGPAQDRLADWLADHPRVAMADLSSAAASADLVINALNGSGTIVGLTEAGAQNLAGKVLVDVSNPLASGSAFPPELFVANSDSLGEQVQRQFPDARVVKTLNTMNCELMVDPSRLAGGAHSVFVSGNDPDAKRTVTGLLHDLGHSDVIDLGDITTARGPEMYLPLWLRLMHAVGTSEFSIRVVR
jgi:predicted dinucleotide-binding enzyme